MFCCSSNYVESESKGVSVLYLNTTFAKEVKAFRGFRIPNEDDNTNNFITAKKHTLEVNIYHLEDLNKKSHGLLRQKGAKVRCPRDGHMGAAYVDCIRGVDNVGRANVFLSYSWGSSVNDILDVMNTYCKKKNQDPKRTYVWLCCLCNNQHRIHARRDDEQLVIPIMEYKEFFEHKIPEIGEVVALISPWNEPVYLTRAWCIFELYTAIVSDECTLHIEMPREAREQLKAHIFSGAQGENVMNKIYDAFCNTNIATADYSLALDKLRILELLEKIGSANALNKTVNKTLRDWIHVVLRHVKLDLKALCSNVENKSMSIELLDDATDNLGYVFLSNEDYKHALDCYEIQHDLCDKHFIDDHWRMSRSLNNLMMVHLDLGHYNDALEYGKKCVEILEKVYGENHLETATGYYNLGRMYREKGDMDTALGLYDKSLSIRKAELGKDNEYTASVHHDIGYTYYQKDDSDRAMEHFTKAMSIDEKLGIIYSSNSNPSLANTYNCIGAVYGQQGDLNKELEYYLKSVALRESILGKSHPETLLSYSNIMKTYQKLGEEEKALEYERKSQCVKVNQ